MGMGRIGYLTLALVALAVAIGGCGDSKDGPGPGAYGIDTGKKPPTAKREKEEVEAIENRPAKGAWGVAFGLGSSRGMYIVDLSGHTLYTFSRDTGGKPTCYGACAKAWPPALAENGARAGGSAQPGKVGTAKRTDGTVQLTYDGHPLYRYSGDGQGDLKGEGDEAFGGEWQAIRPNGEQL
jgi:predicted lipoprotein with Yx(FWY)xxD motif